MRPETQYPRWDTWHESVWAMGLRFVDHFQPGSNTPRATGWPARLTTSAWPLPSNGRVSSGDSKFLTSTAGIAAPLDWTYAVRASLPYAPYGCKEQNRATPTKLLTEGLGVERCGGRA